MIGKYTKKFMKTETAGKKLIFYFLWSGLIKMPLDMYVENLVSIQ